MKRYFAGLFLALLLLSGCTQKVETLVDTPTCTITREAGKIALCGEDESYLFTKHRVRADPGTPLPLRTLIDSDEFLVRTHGGILIVDDRAAGKVYVIW